MVFMNEYYAIDEVFPALHIGGLQRCFMGLQYDYIHIDGFLIVEMNISSKE